MSKAKMSREPNLPLPANTNINSYEDLAQKERMIASFPYNPFNTELARARIKPRKLVTTFNALEVDDSSGQ